MAGYIVRVELPGGESSEVYKMLHLEMGKAEFLPYFLAREGNLTLPHGTYVHEGAGTYRNAQQAHFAAITAARNVDPEARAVTFQKEEAIYSDNLKRWPPHKN
jgi:hypothetical protein